MPVDSMSVDIGALAERLDTAALNAEAIPQLALEIELSEADAYKIQAASIARRLARGETRNGMKMGLTSRAKAIQMGVDDVVWGRLTDAMVIEEGGFASMANFIHPRVEPEIAFLLKRNLAAGATALEAQRAIAAVAPAIEIIDSRYKDFKFSLGDTVADNTSAAGLVIGPWNENTGDIANLGVGLSINGQVCQIGTTAAILGHPIRSLVAAADRSGTAGEELQAGWIVMAGGATAAEALSIGDHVSVEVQGLGHAGFTLQE
ncbi:MAG: fumarylacetoacetate hydrolase family protein [Alphaproteobacteria bacterium]|nr:fumarylacetoacetate hydrolase family protein [Alphaproteobacteria bacterium]